MLTITWVTNSFENLQRELKLELTIADPQLLHGNHIPVFSPSSETKYLCLCLLFRLNLTKLRFHKTIYVKFIKFGSIAMAKQIMTS